MNRLLLATALLSFGLAASASAAISVGNTTGNDATFDNNPLGAMTGISRAWYNGGVGYIRFAAGADTTGVSQGTNPGISAMPAGDSTHYLWGLVDGTTVTFTDSVGNPLGDVVTSFKIHWGSIDALSAGRYDNLLTLSNGDSVNGSWLVANMGANGLGDQFSAADNRWFVISSDTPFGSFTVNSPQNAFEFDMSVPEPATWAMMLVGFGAIGSAVRRQRRMQTVTA